MTKNMEINRALAEKVLEVVDAGLVKGVGTPQPGKMCVEAAVCYAMGLPHGDNPSCVAPALRQLKIGLNDSSWSSNRARAAGLRRLAIAQLGSMDALDQVEFARRVSELAIRTAVPNALRAAASIHPSETYRDKLLAAAERCEREGTKDASDAARAASYAAGSASDTARAASYAASAASYAARAASDAASAASDAASDAASYAASAASYAARDAARAASDAASDAARDKQLADFAEGVVQILIAMKAPGCEWLGLTEAA